MVYLLPLVIAAVTAEPLRPLAHDPVVTRSAPAPAELLRPPSRRVSGLDPAAGRLLAEGLRRSRTFASLMSAIQKTDVIVSVETTRQLPPKVGGRLLFEGVTAQGRYLRVQILDSLRLSQAIEVLAHELRHVLEVAEEPSVVDDQGMIALYRRIGYRSHAEGGYDTNAARLTGHVVRRELGG
jgi:hypothetical protein